MVDDNKELVEVILTAYNKYADKIGAPRGYIACMEAALSIIQPELDKRDAIIEAAKDVLCAANQDSNAVMQMELRKLENALKTTTGPTEQSGGER